VIRIPGKNIIGVVRKISDTTDEMIESVKIETRNKM
jgi:hypothetical protein